jgi:hypothetical protein
MDGVLQKLRAFEDAIPNWLLSVLVFIAIVSNWWHIVRTHDESALPLAHTLEMCQHELAESRGQIGSCMTLMSRHLTVEEMVSGGENGPTQPWVDPKFVPKDPGFPDVREDSQSAADQ